MNRREAENYNHLHNALQGLGFKHEEVEKLIRIQKTLHRWSERECGDGNGWYLERDEETGKTYNVSSNDGNRRYRTPDRETGALRSLAAIIAARNEREKDNLTSYNQGDCRGCSLYIIRPNDVREGQSVDSCYSNGIAVCY